MESYYILPVRCGVVSPLTPSRAPPQRQKASVLNAAGDFNHLLLQRERVKRQNNISKPIRRTKARVFPCGGIEEEELTAERMKAEESGFILGLSQRTKGWGSERRGGVRNPLLLSQDISFLSLSPHLVHKASFSCLFPLSLLSRRLQNGC